MAIARALHEHLAIPAEVLLRESGVELSNPLANVEWSRFPVKAMAKHGIPLVIVQHLPKTYLDGAALRLGDRRGQG